MKRFTTKICLLMLVVAFGVFSPLSAAFISLTNPSINPKPLDRVENNGVGTITFGMVETSNAIAPTTDILGETNLRISLEMNKLKLTGDDVANITGTLMNYFSATYNAVDKKLTVDFYLPKGSYATTFLEEIGKFSLKV